MIPNIQNNTPLITNSNHNIIHTLKYVHKESNYSYALISPVTSPNGGLTK